MVGELQFIIRLTFIEQFWSSSIDSADTIFMRSCRKLLLLASNTYMKDARTNVLMLYGIETSHTKIKKKRHNELKIVVFWNRRTNT
jgi:hypothetical protein